MYYYNFASSLIYHYNSPIWRYAITILRLLDACHFLRLRRSRAHVQTSMLLYRPKYPCYDPPSTLIDIRPHMSSPSSILSSPLLLCSSSPGRDGGGGRGRHPLCPLCQRLWSVSSRLGLERCQGQERRQAGVVGGDGQRSIVLARSRGRCGRRLPAAANIAAAGDDIGVREAI